jgi:hypothetical protein
MLRTLVFLGWVVMFWGCQSPQPDTRRGPAPVHVLISSTGTVELRKLDWTHYATVSFPAQVMSDDLLKIARGTVARIVCSDLTVQTLSTRPPGPVPCPSRGELVDRSPYLLLRNATPPTCPVQLSPRTGQLVNSRPEVRWSAIPETSNYRVELVGDTVHWIRNVHLPSGAQEGRLAYPPEVQALAPGVTVTITISGAGRSSNECASQKPGIRVLSSSEQASLHAAENRLERLGLSAIDLGYMRANLWLSHELYAESIDLLDRRSQSPDASVAVLRLLGDAYCNAELTDHAIQAYKGALRRAAESTSRPRLRSTLQ